MSDLPELEKHLDEAASAYVVAFRLTNDLDPALAAKLDAAIQKVAAALTGHPVVPRSVIGKLLFVPYGLFKHADTGNDPEAAKAAALRYYDMIREIFPNKAA